MLLMHAHIYFDATDRQTADRLYQDVVLLEGVEYFDQLPPIGPHPLSMIEIHFKSRFLDPIRTWLEKNRGPLSILIHEETGQDVRDHTENTIWLGKPVDLRFDFFDLILRHPELKVHPDKP